MNQKFTKDTTIGDALRIDRRTAVVFMNMGMHCIGCPMSAMETIEQACMGHGVDVEQILQQLNELDGDKK